MLEARNVSHSLDPSQIQRPPQLCGISLILPGLHHRSLHVSEAAVESAEVGCSASAVPLVLSEPAIIRMSFWECQQQHKSTRTHTFPP